MPRRKRHRLASRDTPPRLDRPCPWPPPASIRRSGPSAVCSRPRQSGWRRRRIHRLRPALRPCSAQRCLEQMAKDFALAKAPVPVLGKDRMVRDLVIQTETAKPAIGEIEMNLFAQSALRAYAHAIAGDQHADHQPRIDRGATGAAVERLQRLTNVIEVEMPIDASQNVIGRDMVVEAEIIE